MLLSKLMFVHSGALVHTITLRNGIVPTFTKGAGNAESTVQYLLSLFLVLLRLDIRSYRVKMLSFACIFCDALIYFCNY